MCKRNVLFLSGVCFVILIGSTVISTFVYNKLLPQVTVVTPTKGFIQGEEYRMVLPLSCVYRDASGDYIFRLKELDGNWKVERCSVRVAAKDEVCVAVFRSVSGEIQVAAEPSRALKDGEIVKIR